MSARRLHQGVLIVSTLVFSWFGMEAVHELGHVLGARLTGGRVAKVVLDPLTISRTDLEHNPRPLLVAWAGPVVGVVLPLALWGVAAALRWKEAYLPRFFAGLCLIANGGYIGVSALSRIGDGGDMVRHGSTPGPPVLFSLVTMPLGLYLLHGLGPHFGLGPVETPVNPRAAYGCLAAAVLVVALCCCFGE